MADTPLCEVKLIGDPVTVMLSDVLDEAGFRLSPFRADQPQQDTAHRENHRK